jgi:transposase
VRKHTRPPQRRTIGLDLGDRYSYFCVLDANGAVAGEGRVATTPGALKRQFGGRRGDLIAIEVGGLSPWVSRVLREVGHEVLVANSRKLRLIYENRHKSDRVDAYYLARVARMEPELLCAIEHRGEQEQVDLSVVRARDVLVRSRTQLINHVRGAVKAMGVRLRARHAETFAKKAVVDVPEAMRRALEPVLEAIASLNETIKKLEVAIEEVALERYPQTGLLRQVHGIGPITALTYVLTIGRPERFRRSRQVGAYLGLTPGTNQSGDSNPQQRITKMGDPLLRRLLVQCAQRMLGPFGQDSDVRRHGQAIAARGGGHGKKRAVIAVARKLAVLLHRLWRTGERYEPLHATALAAA